VPGKALLRAKTLDGSVSFMIASMALSTPRDVIAQMRTYLLKLDADAGKKNNVYNILKTERSRDAVFISVGPSFDKGPTESHFYLESGSRLSFGVTIRDTNPGCSLVAYRFQMNLPEAFSPSFYRFDLNENEHDDPLLEPRCHIHAGVEEIRLPCPALTPLAVLDRIFLVIEPRLFAA
jgi:hypothetical protein